jgi:hypothetical protein
VTKRAVFDTNMSVKNYNDISEAQKESLWIGSGMQALTSAISSSDRNGQPPAYVEANKQPGYYLSIYSGFETGAFYGNPWYFDKSYNSSSYYPNYDINKYT